MSGSSSVASGSEVGSSAEGGSRITPGNEDGLELDETQAFFQGVFGVLYTVSKEKNPGWRWAAFKLGVDFLQLWLILVNPTYGYTGWITQENKLWQVVALINLSQFLQARGYTFFLGAMYVMAVGLLVAIGLCAWVGHSFQNNRFDHVWPIVVLRFYSVAFFQVLDIASLTLFLETLDCQLWFTEHPSRGFHALFPGVRCWAMPHMIHVITGMISLVLFTGMAGAFTMAEMHDLNPLSTNPLAMAHSRVEVTAFALKFIMTAASTLVMNLKWLSSIQAACCLLLAWLYFKWVPHMNSLTNNIRVGLYSSVLYCSIMLLLMSFLPAVDYNDPSAVREFQQSITYAMWAGIVPAFGLGWLATSLKQKWFDEQVLQQFRTAYQEGQTSISYKLDDAREAEILVRCCRTSMADGVPDPEEVALAEYIIKIGMSQLPNNAFMILLYSSFLIDVQTSYQSGYSILQTARKCDPTFLERFAIFSREQQHAQSERLTAQKSSSSQPGQATDLVSYVEFQRNYRLVLKVHREALTAAKNFWLCLLQRSVKFDSMSSHIDKIESAVKQADRVYRNVLQRHANSVKVVKLYAKFLEHVKHDPWAAAKWTAESEKLEQVEEENKASNVFDEMDGLDPTLKHNLEAMGPMSDVRAIVIINAQCIVQATNQATCDMFGFSRAELVGRNVNCLIPPPFSDHHNGYVQNYIATGKSMLLGKQNQFVALHKEKYVVPVKLTVSKISGIGEDSTFIGVLESTPAPPATAQLWILMNSQLVCVDPTFSEWFAFNNEEVVGSSLSTYVVDYKRLEETMKQARAVKTKDSSNQIKNPGNRSMTSNVSFSGSKSQPEWLIPGLAIAHKYADPIAVDAVLTIIGVGSHNFMRLDLKRASSSTPREMLVSDKKGRILHMTNGLATALGSTPKTLMAQDSREALQALMVQPFAQLHRTLGMSVPPHAPPAYSCRAGFSMLMSSVGPQGPDAAAFRMHVRRKVQGGELNAWHVATLEPRTIRQAVHERCMSLVVNAQGYVIEAAGNATSTPFGFKPQVVLGTHVSSFLDVFKTDSSSAKPGVTVSSLDMTGAVAGGKRLVQDPEGNAELDMAARLGYVINPEQEEAAAAVLMELATKSLESPGISWRCTVARPDTQEALAKHKHMPSVAILGKARVKTGMLSVALVLNGPPSSHDSHHEAFGGHLEAGPEEVHRVQPVHVPEAPALGRFRRGSMLGFVEQADTLKFEITLWRAKIASSIIEIDGAGRVVGSSPGDKVQMLYPAGLVLGAPDEELYGQPLSQLLPLGSRGVRALFDVLPTGDGTAAAKPKSLLKGAPVVNDKNPGPVQIMTTKHLGDFRDIKITVQAIPKLGRTNNMYLLIHPHEPQGGRPSFISWVLGGGLTPAEKAKKVDKHLEKQLSKAKRVSTNGAAAPSPAAAKAVEEVPEPATQGLDLNKLEFQLQSNAPLDPLDADDKDRDSPRAPEHKWDEEERGSEGDQAAVAAAAKNPRIVRWIMSEIGDAPPDVAALQPLEGDEDEDEDDAAELDGDASEELEGSDNVDPDIDIAAAQVGSEGTDYRRGRRYKKLLRVLSSAVMQRDVNKFKRHTYGVVAALLVAHVAVFAFMYILLSNQDAGVEDLNTAGLAVRYAGEMGLITRQLELLYDPIEVSSPVQLTGLEGPQDIPPLKEWYKYNIEQFRAKHAAFYLGADGSGRALPTINGLRNMWETPILDEANFVAIPFNESIDFNHTVQEQASLASLWAIGNSIVTAGYQILQNGEAYQRDYGHLHYFTYFEYIMANMPNSLSNNYFKSMDTMVEFVLHGAAEVNKVQLILLAVEGCVLCSLACSYLWLLSLKVAGQRYSVFSVFLYIPLGLAKGLATRKFDLEDEEEEEDEDAAPTGGGGAGGGGGGGNDKPTMAEAQKTPGAISVFLRQADTSSSEPQGFWDKLLRVLMFWRPADTAQNQGSKRKLLQSYRQSLLLVWPFALWGVCIIATYALGVVELASISGPIATFNMVNFVAARTHVFFFELQELVIEFDQSVMDQIRLRVVEKYELIKKDYTAMMYGGQALPNETSNHFTLATMGLTYAGGTAADILFYTTSCLCEDPKYCKEDPTNIYHQDTHNGLARLMNQFLKNAEAVGHMNGLDPWLFGPEFAWFWYVRQDILGGLARLDEYYHGFVMEVYGSVLNIHMAALILTVVIMLGFVMLVLRPFIRKNEYEAKRIAELLSQLPADLDVESLVLRAMPKNDVQV